MVEREQGPLAGIPLKLRDEIERFQTNYTFKETKILDFKRIVSKPYLDKSIEVVSHETIWNTVIYCPIFCFAV